MSISLVFHEFFSNFPGGLRGLYARFRQLDATFAVYILMIACYHSSKHYIAIPKD